MAVTRTTFAGAGEEQFLNQVEKVVKSHSLRTSESLCRLLQYLANQALHHPEAPLKEYQIATEVYGRPSDFDPQSDSTIRVQVGRLRLKLAEYYAGEGSGDRIVVTIPKGSYHLVFEVKLSEPQLTSVPRRQGPPGAGFKTLPVVWQNAFILLGAGLLISSIALGAQLWTRKLSEPAAASPSTPPAASSVAAFWRPFTSGVEQPWVIFSNAAFVGRPETGMRYYSSSRDANTTVYDHYTGVGEVLAIHALDDLFASLGQKIRVKRGSLFSLDDVKNTNLIFVGSPSENLSLLDVSGTQEFVFQRQTSGPRQGDLSIVSRHPKPGEASTYLASPSNVPMTEDYAVLGLVPGVGSGRFVMILAGTTTFGTQGAVEFVCRQDSLLKLLRAMPNSGAGPIQPFEALVRVKISRGVPVETELVAVRPR